LSFRLESPIHAPKILVFGRFYPQNLGAHLKALLARNDAFWALIGPDLTHSATCVLGKENKKKERQWQTGYLLRPPTSSYRSQSLHAGWPSVWSSTFQVLLKSVQWFCAWSKIALSHYFGHWLTQQLVLPYTSRDLKVTIIQRQITRKWYNIELYLRRPTNRKSYMFYRTALFSVTLNDP